MTLKKGDKGRETRPGAGVPAWTDCPLLVWLLSQIQRCAAASVAQQLAKKKVHGYLSLR
jgi:hypothetical protein